MDFVFIFILAYLLYLLVGLLAGWPAAPTRPGVCYVLQVVILAIAIVLILFGVSIQPLHFR